MLKNWVFASLESINSLVQSGYNQEQGILILRISSAYCAAIKDNTALSLTAILNAKIDVGKHMK